MAFLKAVVVFVVFNVASNVEYVQATKHLKVRFSPDTYEVYESIGKFDIEVVLDGKKPKGDIQVSYKTVDGDAKENTDYVPATGTVTFKPNTYKQFITLEIVNDSVEEAVETFKVEITGVKAVDSNDVVEIGAEKEALIKILDDDKTEKKA